MRHHLGDEQFEGAHRDVVRHAEGRPVAELIDAGGLILLQPGDHLVRFEIVRKVDPPPPA
jgi:hypothetical protein